MAIDKATLGQLKRFATAFREARERNANESDTVMYLVKFFEEILSKEAFQEAADIRVSKSRKKKRRVTRTNATSGEEGTVEVEEGIAGEPAGDPVSNGAPVVTGAANGAAQANGQSGSHQQ